MWNSAMAVKPLALATIFLTIGVLGLFSWSAIPDIDVCVVF